MYISCQMASMRKGFLPMRVPAHCSRVSLAPPSPTPVIPASVSTVTTMLLWLKSSFRFGGRKIVTFVIFIFGSAASTICGRRSAAAGAAARDFRKDLRNMGVTQDCILIRHVRLDNQINEKCVARLRFGSRNVRTESGSAVLAELRLESRTTLLDAINEQIS